MTDLRAKLNQHFPQYQAHINLDRCRWHVHCVDVAQLKLCDEPSLDQEHLVIIAGVGGDRVIDLVGAIMKRHANQNIEFLLCPIHHNYQLREALLDHELGLINEKLVCENNRHYEIIHVSHRGDQPISLVGSIMWNFSQQEDRDYLHKTIKHFERKIKGAGDEYTKILAAYRRLQTD